MRSKEAVTSPLEEGQLQEPYITWKEIVIVNVRLKQAEFKGTDFKPWSSAVFHLLSGQLRSILYYTPQY